MSNDLIELDEIRSALSTLPLDKLTPLITKASQPNSLSFHTFSNTDLEKLASEMKEVDRAARIFGRSSSQTSSKLISLTMLDSGPYRAMKQCLAQIESRRTALKDNLLRVKTARNCLANRNDIDALDRARIELDSADAIPYIEGAIKEIAIFKDAYDQIRENNNIPENWDEKDFEESEISHHLKHGFKLAYRDYVSSKVISPGALEYLEQFGVHPQAAVREISRQYAMTEKFMQENSDQVPTIDTWHDFLDRMVDLFGKEHEKVSKRIGLSSLITEKALYRENLNEEPHRQETEAPI